MMRVRLLGIAEDGRASGGLAARLVPETGMRDQNTLLAHHRLVVANAEAGPFLPAPFGIGFTDEAEAGQAVMQHASQLSERLAHLGTDIEWLLRGPSLEADQPPATGRDFLKARARRQAQQRDAEACATAIARHITTLGCPFVAQRPRTDGGRDLVFSTDRSWSRSELATAIALADHPGWRLTGPWPAYAAAGLTALFRNGGVQA